MDLHKNARLSLRSREALVRKVVAENATLKAAAAAFSVSRRTAAKWVQRFRAHGSAGLVDRSSCPHRQPRTTALDLVQQVEQLRRQRWAGNRIALQTGLSRATVSRILRRLQLNRLRYLEPAPPVLRYEHAAPGDLLHLDIKQLGRIGRPSHRVTGNRCDRMIGIGWERLHVAVDDHSRIAFSAVYPDETAPSVIAFLHAALVYYARFGIRFRALLTDNGSAYRSRAFAACCRQLGLHHRFTRPYTPRTNGKAERFIQTALREWTYARTYQNSDERTRELPAWLHEYNWHRPHSSLGHAPPISRSGLDANNLLRHHT
jgi:transposase InsO family protein